MTHLTNIWSSELTWMSLANPTHITLDMVNGSSPLSHILTMLLTNFNMKGKNGIMKVKVGLRAKHWILSLRFDQRWRCLNLSLHLITNYYTWYSWNVRVRNRVHELTSSLTRSILKHHFTPKDLNTKHTHKPPKLFSLSPKTIKAPPTSSTTLG